MSADTQLGYGRLLPRVVHQSQSEKVLGLEFCRDSQAALVSPCAFFRKTPLLRARWLMAMSWPPLPLLSQPELVNLIQGGAGWTQSPPLGVPISSEKRPVRERGRSHQGLFVFPPLPSSPNVRSPLAS